MSVTQGLKSADTGELVLPLSLLPERSQSRASLEVRRRFFHENGYNLQVCLHEVRKENLERVANRDSVSLQKIDVDISMEGLCANVDAIIHYHNMDFVPVGAQFYCILGHHCVLYKFEAEIQDRIIIGECVEKKKIEEDLQDAIANMRRRYKYCPAPEDSFRCYLGNLPPDTKAIVRLSIACELHVEPDGSVYFQLPAVLNPPYSQFFEDVRDSSTTSRGHRISNGTHRSSTLSIGSAFARSPNRLSFRSSTWRNSWASWASGGYTPSPSANTSFTFPDPSEIPYSLNLNLTIKSFQEIADVVSRQAKVDVKYLNMERTSASVSLPDPYHFSKVLSFRVHYVGGYNPNVLWERGNKERGGMLAHDVLMIDFCPDLSETITKPKKSNRGEFIFFVDRSGSMRGDKMRSARIALLTFLKSLPVGCYFNLVGFGNNYVMCFPGGSKLYNKQNLEKAMRFQSFFHSNMGGSELLKPLKCVYKRRPMRNHPRKIFILTDGDVLEKRAVIEIVRKNAKNTRVFTYGIGDNVSTTLVKGLARAGKGKHEFIQDITKIQSKITSLLKCAMKPCVTDVNIEFDLPEPIQVQQIPTKISALYSGQRQLVFATMESSEPFPQDLLGAVTLTGMVDGTEYEQKLEFFINGSYTSQAPIHRLAARAHIEELEMDDDELRCTLVRDVYLYSAQSHALETQAVMMSVLANVKSRFTGFIAYNQKTGERVADPLRSYFLRSMRRAGRAVSTSALDRPSSRSRIQEDRHSGLHKVLRKFFSLKNENAIGQGRRSSSMPTLFQKSPRRAPLADITSELKVSQWDLGFNSDTQWKQFLRNISAPSGLIQLQNFDGSWDVCKRLSYILGIPIEDVEKLCPYKDTRVWATLLAVWYLRDRYYSRQDEWEMIQFKALQWLKRRGEMAERSIEECIDKAGNILLQIQKDNGASIRGNGSKNHVRNDSANLSWDYMTTGHLSPEKIKMAQEALLNSSATSAQNSVISAAGTLVADDGIATMSVSDVTFDSNFTADKRYNFGSKGLLLDDSSRCETPVIQVNGDCPAGYLDELDDVLAASQRLGKVLRFANGDDWASLDSFNPMMASSAQSTPIIRKKRSNSDSSSYSVQYESAV